LGSEELLADPNSDRISKHWVLECDDGECIADSGEDDENGRRDGEPSQSGVPLLEGRDGAMMNHLRVACHCQKGVTARW